MRAEKHVDIKVVLVLTELEARNLMGWMQNPLTDNDPDDLTELREKLFISLHDALGNEYGN